MSEEHPWSPLGIHCPQPDGRLEPVDLTEHPEGGRFSEMFRSAAVVTTGEGKERSALTHIYFSLNRGEVSRFHRVTSDEVWNLYRGEGVRLYTWDSDTESLCCIELSAHSGCFCHVVPAGYWQAAEPIGDSVLVGCSVGPGFEFQDFEMIAPDSETAKSVHSTNPTLARFILP